MGGYGLSSVIIVAFALTRCQDFSPCLAYLRPFASSFVTQPCSQEPSLGVLNGMLAVLSMVYAPYMCACVTAYICMNEKWE